jgi:uncharacterized protein with NRDE domain
MCTLILLRRPDHDWPLLLAANRDEMATRPWQPPGRHWPDRGDVVAGIDELSGGSWLGLNDHGLVAAVLNRYGSLGPAPDKRSRGELVLEALDHAEAGAAAMALADLDPTAYRSFNLVVADPVAAFWLRHAADGGGSIEVHRLPAGLTMLTARERNDPESPRIHRFLDRFDEAAAPRPEADDWSAWQALLADRSTVESDPGSAMAIDYGNGFQTVSSSLIALPAVPRSLSEPPRRARWLFAAGAPDETAFAPVNLAPVEAPA